MVPSFPACLRGGSPIYAGHTNFAVVLMLYVITDKVGKLPNILLQTHVSAVNFELK
jgi:hypothetical protein